MHNNNGFNSMLTTPDTYKLTARTPEASAHYGIKDWDSAYFHPNRPVIILRTGTGSYGTSLEYSPTGGRNWQIVSFHDTAFEAIEAFAAIGLGKDTDPRNYRILKES